jgi:hypothetical protein
MRFAEPFGGPYNAPATPGPALATVLARRGSTDRGRTWGTKRLARQARVIEAATLAFPMHACLASGQAAFISATATGTVDPQQKYAETRTGPTGWLSLRGTVSVSSTDLCWEYLH